MDIRPILESEVATVAEAMGRHPVLIADRLARQSRGDAVYLIAWDGGRPVGQALLHWRRPAVVDAPDALLGFAYLEDLHVPADRRRRGTGTQLMEAAAARVRQRGGDRITLAVNVDNADARRLYARLGYVEAGTPTHTQPFWHYGPDGELRRRDESVMDLVVHVNDSDRRPSPQRADRGS
jgi:GNAT superfamily N-acetyltransferase